MSRKRTLMKTSATPAMEQAVTTLPAVLSVQLVVALEKLKRKNNLGPTEMLAFCFGPPFHFRRLAQEAQGGWILVPVYSAPWDQRGGAFKNPNFGFGWVATEYGECLLEMCVPDNFHSEIAAGYRHRQIV